MTAVETFVSPWTAQLLERRLAELGAELRTICADSDGTSSLEDRLQHLMRRFEAKYLCTPRHGERAAHLVQRLGGRLGLSSEELQSLTSASLLHDIGKVGVPELVLFRPGKRRGKVKRSFETHPVIGAGLLASLPHFASLAPIVRHHHERWDGNGYPDGLAGDAIPLGARIVSVADTFDALTAGRLYRPPMSGLSALREIARHSGSQFDPAVVSELAAAHEDGELASADRTCAHAGEEERRLVVS